MAKQLKINKQPYKLDCYKHQNIIGDAPDLLKVYCDKCKEVNCIFEYKIKNRIALNSLKGGIKNV